MNAVVIVKGGRFAVEFDLHGRRYRTLFTSYRSEAAAWADSVAVYGWTVSGRPLVTA
jgi:hypothetical protein